MKLLFIAPRFHTNLAVQLAALLQAGHDVKIVAYYQGKSERYESIQPIVSGYSWLSRLLSRLLHWRSANSLKSDFEQRISWPDMQRVNQVIDEFVPDFIFLKDYQTLSSLRVLLAAKRRQRRVIVLLQTKKNHIKGSKRLLQIFLRVLRWLNVVHYITPVQDSVDAWRSIGLARFITYLPFTVYVPEQPARLGLRQEIKRPVSIISVGKFVRRKEQLLLLQAVKSLLPKYSLRLDLIGEAADQDYIKEIKDYIEREQLGSYVRLRFAIPHADLQLEYSRYDLFVLPSSSEPAAVSPVEAMAQGLPVICSTECGTRCYIQPGLNGFIFAAHNERDLAESIARVISDPKRMHSMGQASHDLALQYHSSGYFLQIFTELILRL